MSNLQLKRIRFSKEADNWLRVLKSRTGITPNILCRLGLCLSLDEQGIPIPEKYPEDSDREINRYTLLGEFDQTFVALMKQRLVRDEIADDAEMDALFRAHIHRGVILLAGRFKNLSDLGGDLVGYAPAAS